jgi:hypothetical protein
MHPNAQIFGYQLPTSATALARVAWINQYDTPASLCRFARCVLYKLIPRRIRYAFCQAAVFKHPLCVQVLKGKDAKAIDQFSAFLVSEIRATVRYPFVDAADDFAALCPCWRAFLGFGELPLRFRQFLFFRAEEAWIGDLLAIRQRCERLKAGIHTDRAGL